MPGQIPGWTQTFADDFTSPSTLSNYQVYGDFGNSPDGSGSCFSANHVEVTGGELVIRAYKDPAAIAANGCTADENQIVTGGVKLTANSQTYGKYEVRMRVDNGQGVSPGRPARPDGGLLAPRDRLHRGQRRPSPRTVDTATRALGHGQ